MHILLTNDDGPLDDKACPYMKYFVDEVLATTDWQLSIVVPNQQRSWIGKAHFAGKRLTATYIYTQLSTLGGPVPRLNQYDGPYEHPQPRDAAWQEWCLIDLTPAACADIGLHHLYPHKPPVDLVVSGPNFGKNSSNLYILALGTVGAAMEAVTHGTKAVALLYSFSSLEHDYATLREAAKILVRLVQRLYSQLQTLPIDLFLVNVPLVDLLKLGRTKVHYAPILQNQWRSIYEPLGGQQFAWAPDFKKVHKDGLKDEAHTDSRVLLNEAVSVTPLRATFTVVEPMEGEIELAESESEPAPKASAPEDSLAAAEASKEAAETQAAAEESNAAEEESNAAEELNAAEEAKLAAAASKSASAESEAAEANAAPAKAGSEAAGSETAPATFLVTFPPSLYIFAPIESAAGHITTDRAILANLSAPVFHFGDYEDLDLDLLALHPAHYFVCLYIYRKALIRKHYLANTVRHYVAKHPQLALRRATPESFQLEVDYAEFLDDALDECYELRHELERGDRTWIVKPSMLDKGQGLRLFRSVDQLQAIFDLFEGDEDDGDDGDDDENGVIVSQLRHFVVQEYQTSPLLLGAYGERKFHLRTYVVCGGDLQVYVYRHILALFAADRYRLEEENGAIALRGHLTNSCMQDEALVVPFWQLPGVAHQQVFAEVCDVVAELFKAAVSVDKINFQPMGNALEVYGIDFLVNADMSVRLLEVNAYPDFKQTGQDLKGVIYGLFAGVVAVARGLMGEDVPPPPDLVRVWDHQGHSW